MSIVARAIGAHHRLVHLLDRASWLPPLVARVTVGWVMVESGWGKLHDLDSVRAYFASLGIPFAAIQAPLASASELAFGAAVLLGLFTRLSAVPLVVIMTVAIVTAKREELVGVSALLGFIEYLYIALLLWLVVAGPGAVSLDRLLRRMRPACTVGAAASAAA